VSRRVYDVDSIFDFVTMPVAGGRGGCNRNAALLLLLHPVHRRRAFVDFADFVRDACVEKNTLGRCRLTGINVRHDADISEL
jgi:hypothetical protein